MRTNHPQPLDAQLNHPAPPSLEARRAQAADFYQSRFAAGLGLREAVRHLMSAQAAHLAQARFDTLGLPRGLAVAL